MGECSAVQAWVCALLFASLPRAEFWEDEQFGVCFAHPASQQCFVSSSSSQCKRLISGKLYMAN